jgi:hypothetical protein
MMKLCIAMAGARPSMLWSIEISGVGGDLIRSSNTRWQD